MPSRRTVKECWTAFKIELNVCAGSWREEAVFIRLLQLQRTGDSWQASVVAHGKWLITGDYYSTLFCFVAACRHCERFMQDAWTVQGNGVVSGGPDNNCKQNRHIKTDLSFENTYLNVIVRARVLFTTTKHFSQNFRCSTDCTTAKGGCLCSLVKITNVVYMQPGNPECPCNLSNFCAL